MPTCNKPPLAASVDIAECQSPPSRAAASRPLARCCVIMDKRFSRCCGGCTVCATLHYIASIYVALHYIAVNSYDVAAGAAVAYVLLQGVKQCMRGEAPCVHMVQATLGVVAAVDSARCNECAPLIWITLLAAVIHFGIGIALFEMMRIGDCRRCLNEAYECECGSQKDALPPGTLAELVQLVGDRWYEYKLRQKQVAAV